MSEKSEASVIGSLPRARPQRRSDKRGARPDQAPAEPTPLPKARAVPRPEEPVEPERAEQINRPPSLPDGVELVGTVVKAAAELAEIGLMLGARALRTAVSRLPRP